MQVTNNTSFPIIAFCFQTNVGYGDDVTIKPNESAEVQGPYLGKMEDGDCHIIVEGDIFCHEKPDDENGFQILPNEQLHLGKEMKGITVRHHLDEVEEFVQKWRIANA